MNENKQFDLAQHVKNFRENMPAHIEYAELQARLYFKKYSALKKEGFTDQQALELCSK